MIITPLQLARGRRAFTLMETVIAIGVVAVLLTTFLAVFGPASSSIRRVLSAQEADRLTSALERELSALREGPDDAYESFFHKAFDWIRDSGKPEKAILLYNYKGDPRNIRVDASLEPYKDVNSGQSGRDFIRQPAVRRRGDAEMDLKADLEQVDGRVFYVRLTQMIYDNQAQDPILIPGTHGEIQSMHSHDPINAIESYPGAIIAYTADFYALKSNNYSYIENLDLNDANGDGRPDALGKPLFSRNLAVRR